jgi:hypothetical protein
MIPIFIPPIPEFEKLPNMGEYNLILKDGVRSNPNTRLVKSSTEAEYIFLDFRHVWNEKNKLNLDHRWLKRSALIDYSDPIGRLSNLPVAHHFKRSMVDKSPHRFHAYAKIVHPISYCVKNSCLKFNIIPIENRKYDIAVFFNPVESNNFNRLTRRQIAQYIKENFSDRKIWVGIAGNAGKKGRCGIGNELYYQTMLDSKIVVNCNPEGWEGDYRLFEALSCSPLVMSDPMITPVINKFVDGEHLVYYNSFSTLKSKIEFYLDHLSEAQKIATSGYEHVMKYHKTSDRIDEIINTIKNENFSNRI